MGKKLEFRSIKNQNIFHPAFQNFTENNIIEFKEQSHTKGGMAVVYAPNGTGKSSLTTVLGNTTTENELFFEAIYDGNLTIQPETKVFHVIGDQISRNVIQGETSDYLVGRDIKREYELKKRIAEGFKEAFSGLNAKYKKDYATTKVSDYFLAVMQDRSPTAYAFAREIVNVRSKGKNIDRKQFLMYVQNPQNQPKLAEIDEDKQLFIIRDSF